MVWKKQKSSAPARQNKVPVTFRFSQNFKRGLALDAKAAGLSQANYLECVWRVYRDAANQLRSEEREKLLREANAFLRGKGLPPG